MAINEDTPKLIDPEKVTPAAAKKAYQELVKDSKTKIIDSPYPNANLVQSGDRFAVLDHGKQEVTYYMEFKERDLEGHKAVYQSMIWRDATAVGTKGVSTKVFFDYLLPMHGIVTTDNVQTDMGKTFWRSAIGEAIHKGLHVYYMDLNKRAKPKPIKTQSDLDDVVSFIWGKGEQNRYRLVMISQKPFDREMGIDLDDFGIPK